MDKSKRALSDPEHSDKPLNYRSYVLTIWLERGQDPKNPAAWRCALEDPRTGRRSAFAAKKEVIEYLEKLMDIGY